MQTDAARRVSSSSGRDSISGVQTSFDVDFLNLLIRKRGCLVMKYQLQWLLNLQRDERMNTYAYIEFDRTSG
jgi:hypothetical protein